MTDTKITLSFAKKLYQRACIERAIRDYRDICTIDLEEKNTAYCCTFSKSNAELQLTAYEFANYLIELENARGGA